MGKKHTFGFIFLFSVLAAFAAGCGILGSPQGTGERPGSGRREISIFITNDVHFLAPSLHDNGPRYRAIISGHDGKNTEAQPALLGALHRAVETEKPDILLLNGDLTFNGERESHESLARYLGELEKTGTSVFVLPGNHDISNPFARSFFNNEARVVPSIRPREFASIYRDFGFAEALSRDRASLSYTAEPLPGLRLLMLDSCKYKNNTARGFPEAGGAFSQATRRWIRGEVKKARQDGALLLVSLHHSIMDHHPMVHDGFTIDDAESFQDLLVEEGVQFVLSGHIHAQEISVRQKEAGTVYDIATSALSVYPHQIASLVISPGGALARPLPATLLSDTSLPNEPLQDDPLNEPAQGAWRYAVKPLDVEAWAGDFAPEDGRFLQFNQWSRDYFIQVSGNMVRRRLDTSTLKAEELEALSQLMGLLNSRYFSGTSYLNAQDIPGSPGYRLLQEHEYEFLSGYARTIMADNFPRDTELTIPFAGR